MTHPQGEHGDTSDVETAAADTSDPTRRRVLRGSIVTASALGLGLATSGTATATGKGGEAAVSDGDFQPTTEFSFVEPTGSGARKTCDKGGQGIVLAEWTFQYVGEDELRTIYTRDNAIETDERYQFTGNGQVDCGGFFLTPFSPASDR